MCRSVCGCGSIWVGVCICKCVYVCVYVHVYVIPQRRTDIGWCRCVYMISACVCILVQSVHLFSSVSEKVPVYMRPSFPLRTSVGLYTST